MAVRGTPLMSEKVSPTVNTALKSAVLEWLLIFMLFIDASLSYLITKFARSCKLQSPCLLCSRLDHVFGNEKVGFYMDLICSNHKLEISSLVLCHVHGKLVDVHGMCESCLFSFATINKSNAETYRLLVSKLGAESHHGRDHDPLLGDHNLRSSGARSCSCCNKQWVSRGYAQKLFHTKSIGYEVAELDAPLVIAIGHNRGDLTKIGGESSVSPRVSHTEKHDFDLLPHMEYMKVKITSGTESEVTFSDDDSATALSREAQYLNEDGTVKCRHLDPMINNLADYLSSEKLIQPASAPEASILESEVQLEVINSHGNVARPTAGKHGLEETNWQQVDYKANVASPSELISFDEVPLSSKPTRTLVESLGDTLYATVTSEPGNGVVNENTSEAGKEVGTENREISKVGSESITTNEICLESSPITSVTGSHMPIYFDLGDAYKLAVGNRGRQLSGKLSEQRSLKDSARVSEDLKLLLSQISATRGIELSLNDLSPRMCGNIDESKTSDVSSSIGIQLLQRRISLERNESSLSLDGSTVSEIEGESVVDWLKRQFEHDKKLMGALYKELEEERNASAVAANQAMAMITRLQEEKSALQMETLQCLRVMEEQAEYDGEALQRANELLLEKEKEVQAIEAEFELYKKKFGDVSMLDVFTDPASDLS